MANKYNLTKPQIAEIVQKFANVLPDELMNKAVIEALELKIPEIMQTIERYKYVPQAIEAKMIRKNYGYLQIDESVDISDVLNFDINTFDIENWSYSRLVLLAELGKINPIITIQNNEFDIFTIFAYNKNKVFGLQSSAEDGVYKRYYLSRVEIRHGLDGHRFLLRYGSETLDITGMFPEFPKADNSIDWINGETVKVELPLSWFSYDYANRAYQVRFPNGYIANIPERMFNSITYGSHKGSDVIGIALPKSIVTHAGVNAERDPSFLDD